MSTETRYALDIRDLFVEFHTEDGLVKAVNGATLAIEKGKTLGLVGETGAGKTTTALAALRLIPDPPGVITGGEIYLEGEDLFKYTERQMYGIRGNVISMIFQDPMTSLNPVLTVGDQIAEVIKLHQDVSQKEAERLAGEMLETVGIPAGRATDYPHQFSGGMKQRVIIAIALACNPRVLIADEPTTALDVTIQAQVLELMKELRRKYDTAMLMITHDLGIVAETCDDVCIMYAGRVIEKGTLRDIFKSPSHPYTVGLFGSLPKINRRDEPLQPIKGLMPDPTDLPSGCPFHPRCDHAKPVCAERVPAVTDLSDTHQVCCLAYEDCGVSLEEKEVL